MCPFGSKGAKPFWAGFRVEGQGFFGISIPKEKLAKPAANLAKVVIEKGNITEEELDFEFKELVNDK